MLFLLLIVSLLFIAWMKPTSNFILLIMLLVCVVLMGYNTNNPDYDNYVTRFELASYPDDGNIFSLLDVSDNIFQSFCKDIGITTYEQYRLILSCLIFSLFGLVVKRECYFSNIFIIIYIVAFLLLDIVQIRNFEAFVLLLPFFSILGQNTLRTTILYMIGVVFSSTFHFSMLFFLLFGLIYIKSRSKRMLLLIVLGCVLFPIFTQLSEGAIGVRLSSYSKSSVIGALFGISFVIANFLCIKNVANVPTSIPNSIRISNFSSSFIYEINYMLLFLIPFYFINGTAIRIFRFTCIINLIFLLNTIYTTNSKRRKRQLILLVMFYIFYFGCYFIYSNPYIFPFVLFNNSLIRF